MASERSLQRLHIPETGGSVRSDWSWSELEKMCVGIYDCPHSTLEYTECGPIIARSQDIRSGVFQVDRAAHVSAETYTNRIARAEPSHGDLLYSREGTYFGIAAEVPRSIKVCLGQRMVLIRPDPKVLQFRYLRYWLNSPCLQAHIDGHRDGSVAERLNLPTIRRLPVPVPSAWEQHAIAHILGTLDNKIELNRRMNETLEAMARALFKSWFVDFDPIRAKAEGRDAGLPKHIADLFPDRFQKSELRTIPEGWAVGSLLEQAQLLSGGTPKTDRPEYWDGQIRWVSARDVSQCNQSLLISTERAITELGLNESATQIIPAFSTVVVARGATTGRMAMLGSDMAMNQTCYALQSSFGYNFALYCQIRHVMDELVHRAHGSIFNTITTNTFQTSRFVLPPVNILREFENRVEPTFHQILAKLKESRTLASIRDALLPKLLSGEIRIKDSQKFVESRL